MACWPLTRYFLSGRWQGEVNERNALGSGGKLARAYHDLVKTMWLSGRKG